MKITNESAFIRECVVLKLLTFFKPSFSVISDIIKFDNGLAEQYNKLDFDKYFDKTKRIELDKVNGLIRRFASKILSLYISFF